MIRLLAVVAFLALPPVAQATRVDSGVVRVGRGAAGARLGMTRAQAVAAVGTPLEENQNGVMSYQPITGGGIFDIYRNGKAGRVRLFIVAGFQGSSWTLDDGAAIFRRGFVAHLYQRYGARVKAVDDVENGEKRYTIHSRYHGRRVETSFAVDKFSRTRSRVLDVYILFA